MTVSSGDERRRTTELPGVGADRAVRLLVGGEEETREVALALGDLLRGGDLVLLYGELGAGKTTFCKGVAEALGIAPTRVTSPTFTIVAVHEGGRLPLVHADAYRISSAAESEQAGLEEALLREDGATLVEWPENVEKLLPTPLAKVRFDFLTGGVEGRILDVEFADLSRFPPFLSRCKRFHTGG